MLLLSLIKPLLVNYLIFFSFTITGNYFYPFRENIKRGTKHKLSFGVLGGIVACVAMLYPIETLGGTRWDFRFIVILIITLYNGPLAGAVTTLIVITFRSLLGGEFVCSATLLALASYIGAVPFHSLFSKGKNRMYLGVAVYLLYLTASILIDMMFISFLPLEFYVVYYSLFLVAFVLMIYTIDLLMKYNQKLDDLKYLDTLKTVSNMSAAFAHEIRNPLTTIRGFVQFLSQEGNEKQLSTFSPIMLKELDRTNKIVTDYIALSKPAQLNKDTFKLYPLLEEIVALSEPMGNYSNITLELTSNERDREIKSDPNYLKQVLVNLINNAIEAMEGVEEGVVHLSSEFKGDNVTISVRDNGVGMTPEELNNIGLPYYTTKTKGTGLGTMIVQKLVRDLNGHLLYTSEKNKGTTVELILPID